MEAEVKRLARRRDGEDSEEERSTKKTKDKSHLEEELAKYEKSRGVRRKGHKKDESNVLAALAGFRSKLQVAKDDDDEMMDEAGAVLVGRRTAEQVDHWGGDHHGLGVRIFVPSHRPPGPSVANYPLVTYVTDGIASAMAQAKAAAGGRNVLVHGAYTAQRALEAGVLDELQIHQIPVLFGGGRRLFELLPSRIELEIVRVIDTPEATHIRYRVRR